MVDVRGTIIASTGHDLGLSIGQTFEISRALEGSSVSTIRRKQDIQPDTPLDSLSRTSHRRIFVSLPITMHNRLVGAVMLSRTPPSIVQALYAKRHLLATALGLIVLLVITMTILTHRLITRPMTRLVKYAEQMTQADAHARGRLAQASPPRLAEIARLQHAIVDMGGQLSNRADYLQTFTRHVSHEFKTPLSSIRGAIELLLDHRDDMTPEQFDRFVRYIELDTARMSQLTDRLNELSQAEMRSISLSQVQLEPLLSDLALQFSDLEWHFQNMGDASVRADTRLLTSVMETLAINARQHHATKLTCTWQTHVLQVTNNGDLISEGNRAKIFTPFFTTNRDQGGTGLGLSIAQAMLTRMGATLSLDPNAKQVSFLIHFDPTTADH